MTPALAPHAPLTTSTPIEFTEGRFGDWIDQRLLERADWGSIAATLESQLGFEAVDLRPIAKVDSDLFVGLPAKRMDRMEAVPIRIEDGVRILAVPTYSTDASYFESESPIPVRLVIGSPKEIRRLRDESRVVGVEALRDATFSRDSLGGVRTTGAEKADLATESGVQKFVSEMLLSAVALGASDVHIEPKRTRLDLRFRIDGNLEQRKMPPGSHEAATAVSTVIKIVTVLPPP